MNKILFVLCAVVSMVFLQGCEKVPTPDEYKKQLESYKENQGKNGGFVVDINKEVDRFRMLPDAEKTRRYKALINAR